MKAETSEQPPGLRQQPVLKPTAEQQPTSPTLQHSQMEQPDQRIEALRQRLTEDMRARVMLNF